MTQTNLKIEDLLDRFTELGLGQPQTLPVSKLSGYDQIYSQRQAEKHLSGLEPDFEHPEQLTAYLKPWKTIIGLAIPYELLPQNKQGQPEAISQVSIMAWEWDYHQELKTIIQSALADVNPERYTFHIDSGPLPERQLALMMGLAKPGRSQMLIHTDHGTAFYLAFVLTDLVAPESPMTAASSDVKTAQRTAFELSEHCQKCRRCQLYCPPKVLTSEADFDGQGCLSALSQKKGRLTEAEMTALGLKLYGCDHCQLCCPANRPKGRKSGAGKPLLTRKTLNRINPETLLYMSQREFKALYGQTGFAWRGLKTLRRNALINMGNSRDPKWIAVIENYMSGQAALDGDVLAETAAWALKQLTT